MLYESFDSFLRLINEIKCGFVVAEGKWGLIGLKNKFKSKCSRFLPGNA